MRVPRAITLREELADDRFVGEGRECDGCDKLLAGRGDDHLHFCTSLDEATNNQARLVGRYRPRNA